MNNYPPFYVGQKVVAIEDSSLWKRGQEFVVHDMRKGCCEWGVDVGIKNTRWDRMECDSCHNMIGIRKGQPLYFAASSFAPISENFQAITLEMVLEVETPLISVN